MQECGPQISNVVQTSFEDRQELVGSIPEDAISRPLMCTDIQKYIVPK